MNNHSTCTSCEFLDLYIAALGNADEILFQGLSTPVSIALAAIATAVFLYRTQIQHHMMLFGPDWEQRRWFQDFFANTGRLIVAALLLSSYAVWSEMFIGTINLAIFTVAKVVISAAGFQETPLANNPDFVFSGIGGSETADAGTELFHSMMNTVYTAIYAPIEALTRGFRAVGVDLWELPASIGVTLALLVVNILASISNTIFAVILIMHKTMEVFVVGMGPLIIGLWVFESTQRYAYAMVKFLLATGSVVIGATFIMGMSMSIVNASLQQLPTRDIGTGNEAIDLSEMNTWVWSTKFSAFLGSYVILVIMMVIAAFLGIAVFLAQRPQLER